MATETTMELDGDVNMDREREVDVKDSLDEEIRRVREEIHTLQIRKSALVSSILSTPPLTTQLISSTTPSSQLTHLQTLITTQSHLNTILSHRLLTGVTIFHPSNPDPTPAGQSPGPPSDHDPLSQQRLSLTQPQPHTSRALGSSSSSSQSRWLSGFRGRRDVLGIRFERYSRIERKFLDPGAVVLELDAGADADMDEPGEDADNSLGIMAKGPEEILRRSWKVAGHDLPAWIGVEEIESRTLRSGAQSDEVEHEDGSEEGRGLRAFVRLVQEELIAGLRRMDAIRSVKERMLPGWVDVVANSSDAREVRVEWEGGRMGRLLLDTQGNIERVVAADEGGRRDRGLEAEVMGKGHILKLRRVEDEV